MGAYNPGTPQLQTTRDFHGTKAVAGDFGSGATVPRNRFVDLSTGLPPALVSGNVSGATTKYVGVVREQAHRVGDNFSVTIQGECYLDALASISRGQLVMAGVDGKARPAAAGAIAHGFALDDGSAAHGVRVYLFPPHLNVSSIKATTGVAVGTGSEEEITHGLGTGLAPDFVLIEPVQTVVSHTVAAEQTGTGSPQAITHGAAFTVTAAIPSASEVGTTFSDITISSSTQVTLTATSGKKFLLHVQGLAWSTPAATQGTHTATKLLITAASGQPFRWTAYGRTA